MTSSSRSRRRVDCALPADDMTWRVSQLTGYLKSFNTSASLWTLPRFCGYATTVIVVVSLKAFHQSLVCDSAELLTVAPRPSSFARKLQMHSLTLILGQWLTMLKILSTKLSVRSFEKIVCQITFPQG